MKTLNPHNLIEGKAMPVMTQGATNRLYLTWKELFNELKAEPADSFDGFIAGYFLGSNVMLREKYIKRAKDFEKLSKKS